MSNQPNHPLKPKMSTGDNLINKIRRAELQRRFQKKREQAAASINVSIMNSKIQTPDKEPE